MGPGRTEANPLHHVELWTADLAKTEPSWDWLLNTLGWQGERVDGWAHGRIWRHAGGVYLVLEQSPEGVGDRHDRMRPGLNHLALRAADRSQLDDLRAAAGAHGWTELFGDRYPGAGGPQHTALYLESTEGFEVEIVVDGR